MHTFTKKTAFFFVLFLLFVGLYASINSSVVFAQPGPNSCGKPCHPSYRQCTGNFERCDIRPNEAVGVCVQIGCQRNSPCCRAPSATVVPTGSVDKSPTISITPPVDSTTGVPISQPAPTVSGSAGGNLGDCASPQGGGVKDGKTDLVDFRQLQLEFNKDVTTLHCDFDANKTVDLIDFNDYFRKGFTTGN